MISLTEIITTCTRDCPDACGIVAQVQNGELIRLKGSAEHPITRGFLCPKMYQYPRMLASQHRLTTPLLRQGGTFVPVSFERAYTLAARQLEKVMKEYGSLAILLYQGAGSEGVLNTLSLRFFNLLGGVTRNVGGLCLTNAVRGQELDFGRGRLGHSPLDVQSSGTIIFWGRNAADTHPHLFYQAQLAQKNGTVLVSVDPRLSRTARKANLHVAVKPGGDWALALFLAQELLSVGGGNPDFLKDNPTGREKFLALVHSYSREELLREAGVPASVMAKTLAYLLEKRPVAIYLGVGMTYGNHGVETVRLINALGALLGSLGEKGGGVNLSFPGGSFINNNLYGQGERERPLFEPSLGDGMQQLADPPLKLAWVVGGNPLAQNPNSDHVKKAFLDLDFVIVNELFMTDTALKSNLIFPVSSFLERTDAMAAWGHNYLGPVNPVLQTGLPSDLEVFQETARLLGLGHEMAGTAAHWLERFLEPLHAQGITWSKLQKGWLKNPLLCDIPALDRYGFNVITALNRETEKPSSGEYLLLTPKPRLQTHSQKLPLTSASHASLHISPRDAQSLDLQEGDLVRAVSPRGKMLFKAHPDPGIGPGAVVAYSGGWPCEGQGVNVLTQDRVTPAGGMTVNETRIRLEKILVREPSPVPQK